MTKFVLLLTIVNFLVWQYFSGGDGQRFSGGLMHVRG